MQESEILKASYKISLNNRFSLKKAQFEENIQSKFNDLNQQFAGTFQNNSAELINLKVKIASMEKVQEQKTKLLIEQEILLRQSINKNVKPTIVRNKVDVNVELEQTLQLQQDLNTYLRSKIQKLVGILVCLKLYGAEYAVKIQQDDFNISYLLMPKMPNYEPVIQSLMDKNVENDQTIKSQVNIDLHEGQIKLPYQLQNQRDIARRICKSNDNQLDLIFRVVQM